jgi:dTDP-4-amino-4,6-dideoxygalactose transaminase
MSQSSLWTERLSLFLFLRFVAFADCFHDEMFHPFAFLLEAGSEIVRAILKKHDEAEGEEREENEPEEPANERHRRRLEQSLCPVNARRSLPKPAVERQSETAILLAMRVPLLDLSEQYRALAGPIRQEIDGVLTTHRFILGPKVEQFEQALCQYTGAKFAIGVSSGTDALLAVLMALQIGVGDAVITTPYSFFATAGCIARVGATPIFVDIEPATFNISPASLRKYIEKNCKRQNGALITREGHAIRAIIPVHLYGLCCEMDDIMRIARDYDLLVIEDAAQAVGAQYPQANRAAFAGTIGDIGCFSFYPSKNLGAAGDAGAVVCNNSQLAARIRICRQHGMEPRYHHQFIGGNFRLDEMQAAVLNVKLPHLAQWSAARRAVADFYRAEFSRRKLDKHVIVPAEPYRDRVPEHHIYHQFVVHADARDELKAHLTANEIDSEIYYPIPLHLQECFFYLEYKRGTFPEAERAAKETLALPIYPELTREAQRFVVEKIAEFYSN